MRTPYYKNIAFKNISVANYENCENEGYEYSRLLGILSVMVVANW